MSDWLSKAVSELNAGMALLGATGAFLGGVSVWIANAVLSRSLVKKKADFDRDIEDSKSRFSERVERLKDELGQAAETHKLGLRKRELLFDREVAAAQAFIQLKRRLLPARTHDDYDVHDASEELGQSLHKVTTALRAFLDEHGAILPAVIRDRISGAALRSEDGSFYSSDFGDEQLFKLARRAADQAITELSEIESAMLRLIRD